MRRSMLKWMSPMFFAVVLMMSTVATAAEEVPDDFQSGMDQQVSAFQAYQNLWNSLDKNELAEPIYPDEYGGEYIDGDKLVIQLVNRTAEMESKYLELTGNSAHVVFEDVNYSLNDLNSLDQLAGSLSQQYRLVSYGVDRRNNEYMINVVAADYADLAADERITGSHLPIRVEESGEAQLMGAGFESPDDRQPPLWRWWYTVIGLAAAGLLIVWLLQRRGRKS